MRLLTKARGCRGTVVEGRPANCVVRCVDCFQQRSNKESAAGGDLFGVRETGANFTSIADGRTPPQREWE